MEKADVRRDEYRKLFEWFGFDVDWGYLLESYAEMPEYEWNGFMRSMSMILERKRKSHLVQ